MPAVSKRTVIAELYRYVAVSAAHLFYLCAAEEAKALEIIREVARELETEALYLFDLARGLQALHPDKRVRLLSEKQKRDFFFVLSWAAANELNGFLIFLNPNPLLEQEPVASRAFKNLIQTIKDRDLPLSCFIISPSARMPEELATAGIYLDLPLPTREEIRALLEDELTAAGHPPLPAILRERFIDGLRGLTEEEIKSVLRLGLYDGILNEEDVRATFRLKQQLIRKEGILEFLLPEAGLEVVGGMGKLKAWLRRKEQIFARLQEAQSQGVDIPKGLLLFGMPGCGKSLMAKAVAKLLGMPLLRLDMGRVLGPYLGQSEENLRKAIKLAETISPTVLWIDEVEKVFSGLGAHETSGGVMNRIFGSILTWMQENTYPVFVVATANDITLMPPEFLRKGRFDEIFFVDFPGPAAREEIWRIHLHKRQRQHWQTLPAWRQWLDQTEGFSGADIEAVVKEAVEEDFVNKGAVEVQEIMGRILKEFKPFSQTMPKKVKEIRKKCEEFQAKPVE